MDEQTDTPDECIMPIAMDAAYVTVKTFITQPVQYAIQISNKHLLQQSRREIESGKYHV